MVGCKSQMVNDNKSDVTGEINVIQIVKSFLILNQSHSAVMGFLMGMNSVEMVELLVHEKIVVFLVSVFHLKSQRPFVEIKNNNVQMMMALMRNVIMV